MNNYIIVFDALTKEQQKAIIRRSIRDMVKVAEHRKKTGVKPRLEFLQAYNTTQLKRLK